MAKTLVYTDYAYHAVDGVIHSERAFSLFCAEVARRLDGPMVVLGRLSPDAAASHYAIGEGVEFVALPFYRSLARLSAVVALLRSLRRTWRAVGEVDRLWLLGPHPLSFVLAGFALLRGRPVTLGVRQDLPVLIRHRHPGRRSLQLAAELLERGYRALARRRPTVVVGPQLAGHYADSPRVLEISVSLIREAQIVPVDEAAGKDYDATKTILSVGRLDAEKNPAMLVETLAALRAGGEDWRLEVCGEGPLRDELADALAAAGLAEHAELAGYVPIDAGLLDRYRRAHVLFHSSLTEGLPQILLEALASGLPVVVSDVGGIRAALGECVRLIAPSDAAAAVAAIAELAADPDERRHLIACGHDYISGHTLELESGRVARFLSGVDHA